MQHSNSYLVEFVGFSIDSLLSSLGILCGWNISLPANIEVLNGSCAFIPCTFEIDETLNQYLTITAKRMWYKDAQKVFDSSSPGGGVLSGTIFGTATEKNCTTRFHYVTQTNTGQYYFRLDQSRDLAYTYSKKLQINIKGKCIIVPLIMSVCGHMWAKVKYKMYLKKIK